MSVERAAPVRKPKPLAYIHADYCTGCEACIQLCPIKDCIIKQGETPEQAYCYVVKEKCIGCTLCVQICPWDCIDMMKPEEFPATWGIGKDPTRPMLADPLTLPSPSEGRGYG